jgi:hypothetical protein
MTDRRQAVVVGTGLVAGHVVRRLAAQFGGDAVLVAGRDPAAAGRLADAVGGAAVAVTALDTAFPADVVVLCTPAATQAALARTALRAGAAVVTTADRPDTVRDLLGLHDEAVAHGRAVVVGAGFCPGLSCVLARHAAALFDEIDEIHVARGGTGGPACARQHHAALTGRNEDWRDGAWVHRRGASGRQLVWFPEPFGARDCYRAALVDPMLLQRSFPGARRITARLAATRRDRTTGWLPMLRPPHADGGPGALRVEVWGRRAGAREVVVYAATDNPAYVTAVSAVAATDAVVSGRLPAFGVSSLVDTDDPVWFLERYDEAGIVVATFEGVD